MKDYEKIEALVDDLLEAYDKNDPDYIAAEPFLSGIKEFYIGCYSYSDLCVWLVEHDMDILRNFRHAGLICKVDYKSPDDWEEAKEDALLVSDDGNSAVLGW